MREAGAVKRFLTLMTVTALLWGLSPGSAGAEDVYTNPGTHQVNGRDWRTRCESYSSTVDRCRTEIWATQVRRQGNTYRAVTGWTFNNLTYLPSPRGPWAGNPLATPGTHTVGSRTWRTQCDTEWTGRGGCRTEILASVVERRGGRYVTVEKWVFNNIVHFTSGQAASHALLLDAPGEDQVTGRLRPGVGDALVSVEASRGSGWEVIGAARTLHAGEWSVPWRRTGTEQHMRARVDFPDGTRVHSLMHEFEALPATEITPTTRAEVTGHYSAGCPLGPDRLRTIRTNYVDFDGHLQRGEIIVRSDLAPMVADVFERSLDAGSPIFQMTNPSRWGGDDISMMAANNTSGFNCRKVVGNPYSWSPHAYGTAVDINPVQNPYRDPTGRWHPSTQYVSRTPVVKGMLTSTSAPVVAFRSHGWEWYSGWDWHHFQWRGGIARALALQAEAAPPPGVPVDPEATASAVLAGGCDVGSPTLPPATAAWEHLGSFGEHETAVVTLEFGSNGDPDEWFGGWQDHAGLCDTVVESTPGSWAGYRAEGDGWSQAAVLDGDRVRFAAVAGELAAHEVVALAGHLEG